MRSSAAAPAAIRRHVRLLALLTALVFAIAFFSAPLFGADADADRVLVPGHASAAGAPTSPGGPVNGALTLVGILALAGAGGWLLWRKRTNPVASRVPRQLAVEETRSLGNRQFLVVASYREKKFLLGVCPGRIDLLAPLHEGASDLPGKEHA